MRCKRLRCQNSGGVGLWKNQSREKNPLHLRDGAWLWSSYALQSLLCGLLQFLKNKRTLDAKLLSSIRRKFISHNRVGDSAYVRQQEVEGLHLCLRCTRRCQRLCALDEVVRVA